VWGRVVEPAGKTIPKKVVFGNDGGEKEDAIQKKKDVWKGEKRLDEFIGVASTGETVGKKKEKGPGGAGEGINTEDSL